MVCTSCKVASGTVKRKLVFVTQSLLHFITQRLCSDLPFTPGEVIVAITDAEYLNKLKTGAYATIGGARKALAKAHLSTTVKAALSHAAEKHFGSVAAAPKKSVVVKGSNLKKDGTPKGKPGRKPGVALSGKTGGAPKKATKAPAGVKLLSPTMADMSNRFSSVEVQESFDIRIQTVAKAIEGLSTVAGLNKDFDVAPAATMAGRMLTHLLESIGEKLGLAQPSHEAAPPNEPDMSIHGDPAEDANDTVARILGSNGLQPHAS